MKESLVFVILRQTVKIISSVLMLISFFIIYKNKDLHAHPNLFIAIMFLTQTPILDKKLGNYLIAQGDLATFIGRLSFGFFDEITIQGTMYFFKIYLEIIIETLNITLNFMIAYDLLRTLTSPFENL